MAGFLLLTSLNAKGYNVLAISVPSKKEFSRMVNLAGPVLLTMMSKVMARLCLHIVFVVFCFVSLFRDLIIVDYHSPLDIMQLLAGTFLYAHHLLGDIFGTSHTSWSPGMLLGQSQFFFVSNPFILCTMKSHFIQEFSLTHLARYCMPEKVRGVLSHFNFSLKVLKCPIPLCK